MTKQRVLVGITEAAQLLGVHPNTLRKWTDDGIVPHTRLPSGYRRYRVEELERFRASLESGGEETDRKQDSGPVE